MVLLGASIDNVNKKISAKMTPLHFASLSGNANIIILLLNFGASINNKNFEGKTPLHYVIKGENTECIIRYF